MISIPRFAALVLVLATASTFVQAEEKQAKDNKDTGDTGFLAKAMASGMAEVQMSEYAAKNATNDKVRAYAEQLVRDHKQANTTLVKTAKRLNATVPTQTEKAMTEKIDKLVKLKGNDFDSAYVMQMIHDHEMAISLFEAESKNGTDPELKTFAQTTLPTLKKHLEEAQNLSKNLKK